MSITKLRRTIRSKRFKSQRWKIILTDSSGTEYDLGWQDVVGDGTTPVSFSIPAGVPNGSYNISIISAGIAWDDLRQKPIDVGSVLIDRTDSEPLTEYLPPVTNFAYDIHEGWIRLLWDSEIALADDGLVSAGIWLRAGVPDFTTAPDFTIPLFSYETSHQFILQTFVEQSADETETYWLENYFLDAYWVQTYWPVMGLYGYAGIALIDSDGNQGPGSSIILPDRTVSAPRPEVSVL